MRTGRLKQPLTLAVSDKEKLELLSRRPKTAQRVGMRRRLFFGRRKAGPIRRSPGDRVSPVRRWGNGGSVTRFRGWTVGQTIRAPVHHE
jgi:hypothetical protein